MSYQTHHQLTWNDPSLDTESVIEALAPLMIRDDDAGHSSDPLDEVADIITGDVEASWQNSDEHVAQISQLWPHAVFTVAHVGEDNNRWWTFYHRGFHYTIEINPPSFCPDAFAATATRTGPSPDSPVTNYITAGHLLSQFLAESVPGLDSPQSHKLFSRQPGFSRVIHAYHPLAEAIDSVRYHASDDCDPLSVLRSTLKAKPSITPALQAAQHFMQDPQEDPPTSSNLPTPQQLTTTNHSGTHGPVSYIEGPSVLAAISRATGAILPAWDTLDHETRARSIILAANSPKWRETGDVDAAAASLLLQQQFQSYR